MCFSDFPLYSEALKFFKNDDQMVRIAVRTLTLNVFGVDDPDLRRFITDKSAVPYFSNLTWFIRDQCIVLNETLNKAIYGNGNININTVQRSFDDSINDKEPSQSNDSSYTDTERKEDDRDDKLSPPSSSSKSRHERSPSFIAKIQKTKRKSLPIKLPQIKHSKTPTNQLQRGVEEQVDHYYYLEVMNHIFHLVLCKDNNTNCVYNIKI